MDDSKNATAQRANEFEEKNLVSEKDVTEQSKSTGNRNETPPPQSKELLDSALDFLSNASNEALFGVFACLMVATYIILGRLGLILIGTIAGVILHASWEGSSNGPHGHETGSTNARRRDFSLRIANRVLDWQTRKLSTDPDTKSAGELTLDLDYTTFRPKTAAALKALTDAVIKDYVNYWYQPILPSESIFPLSCRRTLTHFITSLSSHLSRKRSADTFLAFLTNSSSMVIVFLNELSTAFETVGTTKQPEETVNQYLEMVPESSLANVLSDEQQRKKLNMIADDMLSSFLDQKAYNFEVSRDFLREILAGVIFQSMMTSFSRPEFINGWIVYLLSGEGESEIMSAIDAGVEGARNQGVAAPKAVESLDKAVDEAGPSPRLSSERTSKDSDRTDKATEDALFEAKRLSAMIAAQDARGQSPPNMTSNDQPSSNQMTNNVPSTQELDTTGIVSQQAQVPSSLSQAAPISPSMSDISTPETANMPLIVLHGASISVDDGSELGDKSLIRSKPTSNYLIQVEPASSRSTGWMTFKKYADFESLHPTLETISRLNRLRDFGEAHPALPPWKGQTKQALARSLERYLHDALQHESLAECDKMRRFLDKDNRLGTESAGQSAKTGFSFPSQSAFENMGKGVLGALSNAPKGVAGGGKAVFDGVTGVFGNAGGSNKSLSRSLTSDSDDRSRSPSTPNVMAPSSSEQLAESNARKSLSDFTTEPKPRTSTAESTGEPDITPLNDFRNRHSSPSSPGLVQSDSLASISPEADQLEDAKPTEPSNTSLLDVDSKENGQNEPDSQLEATAPPEKPSSNPEPTNYSNKAITDDETQISVELIFAVINELYTLSSAWNIRRTLLNAAKSYILRPGSPALETIRASLQESVIDANTSDDTIGMYLTKLRENALPTETEFKNWPPPPSDAEKARLRENARKLLIQKGLPQALTSVMGAVASREALGKIFDCLQVETIARGFIFSILLQSLRAVIL